MNQDSITIARLDTSVKLQNLKNQDNQYNYELETLKRRVEECNK
jgi:hypothetical protein